MSFHLVLYGQPVPAAQRNQFNAIPKRQRDMLATIRAAASREMGTRPLLAGPLGLALDVFLPIPSSRSKKFRAAALAGYEMPTKRPDLKNFLWLAEDALTSVVYADDSQVCVQATRKVYSDKPRIEIDVYQLATHPVRDVRPSFGDVARVRPLGLS